MSLVLVGCEESQAVMLAFRALGHQAYSCDLLPCSGGFPQFHLQMDVFEAIALKKWDTGIFFPDCTFLTCSAEWAYGPGPYHQKVKPETLVGEQRRIARENAIQFVKALWNCGIPRIAIENPIGVLSKRWMKPTQIIHPHQFNDDASKATCLWLNHLPKLIPTYNVSPRLVNGKPRWGNQTDSGQNKLPPTDDRAMLRAKTYPGIAAAMAEQWSPIISGSNQSPAAPVQTSLITML